MPGPVPKRSDQKHGHRAKAELDAIDRAPAGQDVIWYAPDPGWNSIATQWYTALRVSGQSVYFEQSDVATAYYLAHEMSRGLTARFNGNSLTAVLSGMTDLLATEGARRRMKVELLQPSESEGPSDVDLAIQRLAEEHNLSS